MRRLNQREEREEEESLPPRDPGDESENGTRVGCMENPLTGEKLNHRSEIVTPIIPPVAILLENDHKVLTVAIQLGVCRQIEENSAIKSHKP